MIALLIFLFILGLLIVVHEFGHYASAKRLGVKVEEFSLGFGPRILFKKKGGTEYSISAIPLGGYVKFAGDTPEEYKGNSDEYLAQSPGRRARIIFCGPLLNYLLGFLCFWVILFAGYPTLTTKVGGLIDGFGAKEAGLKVGDKIIAVDGVKVDYWEDLQKMVQEKGPVRARLSIIRDNQEQGIDVEIKAKELDDIFGAKRSIGLLGITPFDEIVKVRHGFFESFGLGIQKTWALSALTYKALWRMATGNLSLRDSVTGPLGIFYITSKAASLGIIAVLHLIAVLSISLAIFNLLPLPVLDGGHLFLLIIEKIRGRPLNVKVDRIITQAGITMMICLALLVTYNDLSRAFGDKIAQFFMVK